MKIFTKTFGCQMNFADSDEMLSHLARKGTDSTEDLDSADAVLVNTCTVRDLAEHKAESFIGRLRTWKEEQPNRLIIVTGCAAERAKKDFLRKFPFIDLVVGAKDIDSFSDRIDELLRQRSIDEELLIPILSAGAPRDFPRPSAVVQYVTIMRGCNYNCTYCIVPSVRGRERYLPINDIIKDVQQKCDRGAKEIWLLGQTVNSYRPPQSPYYGYEFSDLLIDVANKTDISRIRYISPHPYYVNQKLIETIATTPKVCPQIHLPVQSGSTRVLQRMKRNYTRESFMEIIRGLKKAVPGISITTDVIVGFPGETQDDFNDTLSLIIEAGFDSAYCFKYSPRPGTASFDFSDDVSEDEKESRVNKLIELVDKQSLACLFPLINTVQPVLVESQKTGQVFRGKTPHGWQTRFSSETVNIGDIVDVKITGHHSTELQGEIAFSKLPVHH